MQQYDCLNRVNYPLCNPTAMSDMCTNASKETCQNVKPVSNICTYDESAQKCTIRPDFQHLAPTWEAAPENANGIGTAYRQHTIPQDQLPYVPGVGQEEPPLGETGHYSFAPASVGMVNTAQWCHNAGGLWLAMTQDKTQMTGGWGCISPAATSDGSPTVNFDGTLFGKYQAKLGLGTGKIFGSDSLSGCDPTQTISQWGCDATQGLSGCVPTQTSSTCSPVYPPGTPSPTTLIDYYDCMKGSDNQWIPLQNNPCSGCAWYDMWGLYEVTASATAMKKFGNFLFGGGLWGKIAKIGLYLLIVIGICFCVNKI